MLVLKVIGKVILVILCAVAYCPLKIVEGIVSVARLCAGLILRFLGIVLVLGGIGCYAMHIEELHESVLMAIAGGICFALPSLATAVLAGVIFLEELLKMIMKMPIRRR